MLTHIIHRKKYWKERNQSTFSHRCFLFWQFCLKSHIFWNEYGMPPDDPGQCWWSLWPLVASSSHFLTQILFICNHNLQNPEDGSAARLADGCQPKSYQFMFSLWLQFCIILSNQANDNREHVIFIEYLLHVRFHSEGSTWGPCWSPLDPCKALLLDSVWRSATHSGLGDAVEATLCLIQSKALRRPGLLHNSAIPLLRPPAEKWKQTLAWTCAGKCL